MEEKKKKKKISLKVSILILLMFVFIIIIYILIHDRIILKNDTLVATNSKDYKVVSVDGKTYYQKLSQNTWNGQYNQQIFTTGNSIDNTMEVVSYSKYLEKVNSMNSIILDKINNYYYNKNCNYIILTCARGNSNCTMELIDCFVENNKIIIYGDEDISGFMVNGSGFFVAIPTKLPIGTEIEYRQCFTDSEISNLENYGVPHDFRNISIDKPIIYLYPTKNIELSVKLGYEDKITCSYPQYTTSWNVLAKTSGDLIDLNTNRKLYALYYESKAVYDFDIQKDGFIVKGSEITKFLEEKLAILGLNEREAEEFIIYWLPKLQENKYNYIRFATIEEINQNMPLEFSIKPDTLVRVLMTYKKIDNPIEVKEQQLETPDRIGFVVVEWGGTEIK